MRLAILLLLVSSTAPAEERRVSSGFGVRADPIHHRRTAHRGIDLPGRHGTPIVAAASGVVRSAGRRGGYGEMIEVAHADGTATRYAHLSRILVRPGEPVAQGQLIARMGSTGRSTGNHLHFEYRIGGVAVDPMRYVGNTSTPIARSRPSAPPPAHRSAFSLRRGVPSVDPAALPDAFEAGRGAAK